VLKLSHTEYQKIGDLMAEALGLVEAVNRTERLKARNDELANRDEEYRKRVKKYPSSTGDPNTRMKLDGQGKRVPGRRRTNFKPS
jgi:hypothetical protein